MLILEPQLPSAAVEEANQHNQITATPTPQPHPPEGENIQKGISLQKVNQNRPQQTSKLQTVVKQKQPQEQPKTTKTSVNQKRPHHTQDSQTPSTSTQTPDPQTPSTSTQTSDQHQRPYKIKRFIRKFAESEGKLKLRFFVWLYVKSVLFLNFV